MTVPLESIARRLGVAVVGRNLDISGLATASSSVRPGDLFVAVRGSANDGHRFLDEAFRAGAVAAVVEDPEALGGRPGLVVPSSRVALAEIASILHGDPVCEMTAIGVTGTNGKTTTTWLIWEVLNALGIPTVRVGTLGMVFQELFVESLTTPDPLALQSFLAQARARGARAVVMEVSSHGLDQRRVDTIPFQVGVFTNLTRDHLDYHGTEERYFDAKARLFDLVKRDVARPGVAVINLDGAAGQAMHERALGGRTPAPLEDLSFGTSGGAPLCLKAFRETEGGSELELVLRGQETVVIRSPLIGRHNAENLAAAFGACIGAGCQPARVAEALSQTSQVPGRLERVGSGKPRVFVDYAHTPDALERALQAVRVSCTGPLWVVFGCGGDRDKGKRPLMAAVAARLADAVVVTSDNPRTEDPGSIIADILSGGVVPAHVEPDRRAAIRYAVSRAGPSSTVVIAGKGHEDYQILGTTKVPFSDQAEALAAMSLLDRQPRAVIG
jgi:UDP-N-acetylmuramoyl-L-alanyl-D-glutamate--2,6-diaminopimelate ligase